MGTRLIHTITTVLAVVIYCGHAFPDEPKPMSGSIADPTALPSVVETAKTKASTEETSGKVEISEKETQQLIADFYKNKDRWAAEDKKAQAEAEAAQSKYPFRISKFISLPSENNHSFIFSFCLGPDQKLYALLHSRGNDPYEDGSIVSPNSDDYTTKLVDGSLQIVSKKPNPPQTQKVVVLDIEGQELRRWELSFRAERIATGADGMVYLGGNGKLAKYSAEGKLLQEMTLPHLETEFKDEAAIKETALEQRDESLEYSNTQISLFQQIIKDKEASLAKKNSEPKTAIKQEKVASQEDTGLSTSELEEQSSDEDFLNSVTVEQLQSRLKFFEQKKVSLSNKTEAELISDFKKELESKNSIHSISLTEDSLIYTAQQMSGRSFSVWKVDLQLGNPKKIVQGLGGCCGQCDVQCHDGKLYVADNTKHRVLVYDLDGQKLAQFGKRGRDGDGENFAGCCNPMNVAFSPTGQILTAESEGYIKCFSPSGEFQALLGRSVLESGCKHVALNMTKDGRYVIFLDQPGSRLVRLEKMAEPKLLENKTSAADESKLNHSAVGKPRE